MPDLRSFNQVHVSPNKNPKGCRRSRRALCDSAVRIALEVTNESIKGLERSREMLKE